ncbi:MULTISPECIES: class I SAM-dependent methyltransferase [Methylomonas]|uniref:Calmodulin-lysine N-methyltransferase n=2 Tax=Methylomonas TaxID=416 RepID=A0A126T9K8_9GAMM|nr:MULTISPECIES: methyltransferase domain-containing protein [Methylomonas]AMK78484.1 methyltransferase type 12 [Methylomonas denitrificans]OAH97411.1 methyltransferase type 12 [Methylomonas methanica]TCV82251.1 lysine methyltransferase [Methylomonas methanica]
MPDYRVKFETVTVAGIDYVIRSLADLQQYADPLGEAELAGISSASWSLFGKVWPSARVLALAMHSFDLVGKRILEIGAGLGLASLVIHRRAGDITVSDWHPLSEAFLNENLLLNKLGPLQYKTGNWSTRNPGLGQFDLIIGSDVLYERQQPEQLAKFIDRHAAPNAQIIIVDPDRGNRVGFCREMTDLGYGCTSRIAERLTENGERYKGRFLTFSQAVVGEAA